MEVIIGKVFFYQKSIDTIHLLDDNYDKPP